MPRTMAAATPVCQMVSTSRLMPPILRTTWSPTGMHGFCVQAAVTTAPSLVRTRLGIRRPRPVDLGFLVLEQGDQGLEEQHELEGGQAGDDPPTHRLDQVEQAEGDDRAAPQPEGDAAGERLPDQLPLPGREA